MYMCVPPVLRERGLRSASVAASPRLSSNNFGVRPLGWGDVHRRHYLLVAQQNRGGQDQAPSRDPCFFQQQAAGSGPGLGCASTPA